MSQPAPETPETKHEEDRIMSSVNLTTTLSDYSSTHLQVDACSIGAIKAVIEVANSSERPLILRVLPEQVGSGLASPGYAGFAGIAELVDFVRARDLGGFVHFCRGGFASLVHGGNSLSSCKLSINRDLDAGVSFFHIDASRRLGARRDRSAQIELELELLRHISEQAQCRGLDPVFEVGGNEELKTSSDVSEFTDYLDAILSGCASLGIETPAFAAARTGTGIRELGNIAAVHNSVSFDEDSTTNNILAESADLAGFRGVSLVAHDCDWLGTGYLETLYKHGIAVACVGEEIGVHETSVFLQLCDATRSASVRQDFLSLALEAGHWRTKVDTGSMASEQEKAVMAAHHLFATPEFEAIKLRLEARCGAAGISLDQAICDAHMTRLQSMLRHLGSRYEVTALTR